MVVKRNEDIDTVDAFTLEEKKSIEKRAASLSNNELLDLRSQAVMLQDKYRQSSFQQDPINSTVYENATMSKSDIMATKSSSLGINHVAKRAAQKGAEQGRSMIEKFSKQDFGKETIKAVSELQRSLRSRDEEDDFKEGQALSARMAGEQAAGEEQEQRLKDKVGVETPPPGNKSILDQEQGYLSNFKDKQAVADLMSKCIPCDLRFKDAFSFVPELTGNLKLFNEKWADMLKNLGGLLDGGAGEFTQDLCNLFKFLDGQCIPDIAGMLSLLSLMQLKYIDLGGVNLRNLAISLISPLLAPIMQNFSSNLDKYADLILGPIRCVVTELEKRIVDIEDQIAGVYNIAEMNRNKFRQRNLDLIDKKLKNIRNERNRRKELLEEIKKKLKKNIDKEKKSSLRASLEEYNYQGDISDIEFKELSAKREQIRNDMKASNGFTPTQFTDAKSATRKSKEFIDSVSKVYRSAIGDLIDAMNTGGNIVKETVEAYKDEIQRLILGRVESQEDQIELAYQIARIRRLISIVKTVDALTKKGASLSTLCEQGGDNNALSQIVGELKNNGSNLDFYQGQDADGRRMLIAARGGTKVTKKTIEDEDLDPSNLTGRPTSLDSSIKTVTFNDLNEVDQLNRQGVVPDIGNVDGAILELDDGLDSGTEMDLHFKNSYAIISNEFCSKSAITFGSSDTVKKWVETYGKENN